MGRNNVVAPCKTEVDLVISIVWAMDGRSKTLENELFDGNGQKQGIILDELDISRSTPSVLP